jgi:WD40 repeat protein
MVVSLAFSRNGTRLAAGLDTGTVRLWDVASGRPVPAPAGHRAWVYSIAFSPDDRLLATSSTDSTVRLWDLTTNREVTRFRGHRGEVLTVRFSPDGRTLASAGADGTTRLWDVDATPGNDDFPGRAFALSLDGRLMAAEQIGTRALLLRDMVAGRTTGGIHTGSALSIPLYFSPPGDALYLATSSNPSAGSLAVDTVAVCNVESRRQVAQIPVPSTEYMWTSLSPDGRLLALGPSNPNGDMVLVDLAARRCASPAKWNHAAFSPNGRLLVTSGVRSGLRIYDRTNWQLIRRVSGTTSGPMAFSPKGRYLAVGGFNTVQVWDASSWEPVAAFRAHSGMIHDIAFAADERTLATCGNDPVCKLWNTATWRLTLAFECPGGVLSRLQFTTDGSALAVMSGRSLHFWRAATAPESDARR